MLERGVELTLSGSHSGLILYLFRVSRGCIWVGFAAVCFGWTNNPLGEWRVGGEVSRIATAPGFCQTHYAAYTGFADLPLVYNSNELYVQREQVDFECTGFELLLRIIKLNAPGWSVGCE